MIDFKEIPAANSNVNQDKFELFARDFLSAMGYSIVEDPNRGVDGGLDIKIKDIRKGVGNSEVFLLVSCKHLAHSNNSVTASMETDILDRLSRYGCTGFIGFYSTIANSSLTNKVKDLKLESKITEYEFFDSSKIETQILKIADGKQLFHRYFPESYIKWMEREGHESSFNNSENNNSNGLTKADLIEAALTAKIITEILDIKEAFWKADWANRQEIIDRLNRYIDYSNIRISKEIFSFIERIASTTRAGFTVDMALAIDSLVVNFFPYSDQEEDRSATDEIAMECVNIAFDIIYDTVIYLGNLAIAQWPLLTLKYIYRYAKQHRSQSVLDNVIERHEYLKSTFSRPERSDLEPALQLLEIFRKDLDEPGMTFPILPEELYNLVKEDEKQGSIKDL